MMLENPYQPPNAKDELKDGFRLKPWQLTAIVFVPSLVFVALYMFVTWVVFHS